MVQYKSLCWTQSLFLLFIIVSLLLVSILPSYGEVVYDLATVQQNVRNGDEIKDNIRSLVRSDIEIKWQLHDTLKQGCWGMSINIFLQNRNQNDYWVWAGCRICLVLSNGKCEDYVLSGVGCTDIRKPFESFPIDIFVCGLKREIRVAHLEIEDSLNDLNEDQIRRKLQMVKEGMIKCVCDLNNIGYYSRLLSLYLDKLLRANPGSQVKFQKIYNFFTVYDNFSVNCCSDKFIVLKNKLRQYLSYDEFYSNKNILRIISESPCLRNWLQNNCN